MREGRAACSRAIVSGGPPLDIRLAAVEDRDGSAGPFGKALLEGAVSGGDAAASEGEERASVAPGVIGPEGHARCEHGAAVP